jgi:hypothetical protein
VRPIVGARSVDQLRDNLGAADLVLDPATVARLDAAASVSLGFPTDFIASASGWVFGAADITPSP